MKVVLMIAYHFPPIAGSSGVQRTLQFVRHLPALGWQPTVLSIAPRAYERTSDDLLADIPAGIEVVRAFGLDAARHLSIVGRYPSWLARPDRWSSWIPAGIAAGHRIIQRARPAALWSTFPIASAHHIALSLQSRSGLPWIADFRDPMAQPDYPEDPVQRACLASLETRIARSAAATCFTAPGARRAFIERHPGAAALACVIENGYDEESFPAPGETEIAPLTPGRLTLLHSGIVYPDERDPSALMRALVRLKATDPTLSERLRLRFRAPVHDEHLARLARQHDVESLIDIAPALPYRAALQEMLRADGLLLLQAANCGEQIPAKLYEYLRAGRPIVALTSPTGDTASALKRHGVTSIAGLNEEGDIERVLIDFIASRKNPDASSHSPKPDCSRAHRAKQLAELLGATTRQPTA